MRRLRHYLPAGLVSLYLLVGLSLTNASLSLVNNPGLVPGLMIDGWKVCAIFSAALFLLYFYLFDWRPRRFFAGEKILPLVAFLCATSLILTAYLEPSKIQTAVERPAGYEAHSTNGPVKLAIPPSYVVESYYSDLRKTWLDVTKQNHTAREDNKAYCAALIPGEHDYQRCPDVIQSPVDWHWYLYQQLGTILIGFLTVGVLLRPKAFGSDWPHPKRWGLEFPVPRGHPLDILFWIGGLIFFVVLLIFAVPTPDDSFLVLFSRTQVIGAAVILLFVMPVLQEQWLGYSGIQALLAVMIVGVLVSSFIFHFPDPIWMAEWVRIMLIVFLAALGARFANRFQFGGPRGILIPSLIFLAVLVSAVGILAVIGDFGAVMILACILFSFIILLLPGVRRVIPIALMVVGILLILFFAYFVPFGQTEHVCTRINLWLVPEQSTTTSDTCAPLWSPFASLAKAGNAASGTTPSLAAAPGQAGPTTAENQGAQEPQSHEIFGAGQIRGMVRALWYATFFGQGLGNGRAGFLPAADTDLMFAVAVEEMGWFGGLLLIGVYCALVLIGFQVARQAENARHALLAGGLAALLGFHALIIIGGTLLALPFTGITVPFLSRGNVSMILSFITVGLLLRVAQDPAVRAGPVTAASLSRGPLGRLRASVDPLGAVIVAGFLLVVLVGSVRLFFTGPTMASAEYSPGDNKWAQLQSERIWRGSILDRDGKPIAKTAEPGKRAYPDEELAAAAFPLVGYLADGSPALGLEAYYDNTLSGRPQGNAVFQIGWNTLLNMRILSPHGGDVKTTISSPIQKAAYKVISDPEYVTGSAVAVVLDSQNGQILADVSYSGRPINPATFDFGSLSADDPTGPLVNRVLQGLYAPGSVFKLATLVSGLDLKTEGGAGYTPSNRFSFQMTPAGGSYWHSGVCNVKTESPQGYGNFYLNEALAFSDNVVFAQMGQDVNAIDYAKSLESLRIAPLAPGATSPATFRMGQVPVYVSTYGPLGYLDDDCQRAYTAFGQGRLQLTPLEITLIGAAIANKGVMPSPSIVISPGASTPTGKAVMSPQIAEQIKKMMTLAVNHRDGSGFNARFCAAGVGRQCRDTWTHANAPDFAGPVAISPAVAGKTGTAELGSGKTPDAVFVGFMTDQPRYVVAVILEEQGSGALRAAPVAREILRAIHDLGNP